MAAAMTTSGDNLALLWILEGLTADQVAAVTHGKGPLLIIVGGGTGKTTVVTRRIAHLVSAKQTRPSEILLAYAAALAGRAAAAAADPALREDVAQRQELARCYREYQRLLGEHGLADFEDQDTNHNLWELVRLLAGPGRNIPVVGGDDQSIYTFRGAAISG